MTKDNRPTQGDIKMTKDNHEAADRRVRKLHDYIPAEWNKNPLSLAHELREFLKSVVDAGTSIDSGGGDGCADLWPVIGGVEYQQPEINR
jgi:hypothetical protein